MRILPSRMAFNFIFVLPLLLAWSVAVASDAKGDNDLSHMREVFDRGNETDALRAALMAIDERMKVGDDAKLTDFALGLCTLINKKLNRIEAARTTRTIAEMVLKKTSGDDNQKDISIIEAEVRLLGVWLSIEAAEEPPTGAEWATRRRERLKYWMHVALEIDEARKANAARFEVGAWGIPKGVDFDSGTEIDPSGIKDPSKRREVESYLRHEKNASEMSLVDAKLKTVKEEFAKAITSNLLAMYRKPPFAPDECIQALKKLGWSREAIESAEKLIGKK